MCYSDHDGYTVILSIKNGEILYLHATLGGLSIRIPDSVKRSDKRVFFGRKNAWKFGRLWQFGKFL